MRLLLDTHVIVWLLEDDPRLTEQARSMLLDRDNMLFYSDASLWEIELKHQAHPDGGIDGAALDGYCRKCDFHHLSIQKEHIFATAGLAPVHRDPFDRLLMAQAECERMKLVSHDGNIAKYELDSVVPI